MKSKLQIQTAAVVCILFVSLAAALAQPAPPSAPAVTPATSLPAPGSAAAIDPGTGLPLAPPAPPERNWIDPNWNDPALVVTNISFDGLPLGEVARHLRELFKDEFNILPMPQAFGNDWGQTTVHLELKNVRASEIFNAMNLVFENERTPLRWELKQEPNAQPLVLLRVLPEAAPHAAAEAEAPQTHRMVYFVGNLVGDAKNGGMTMEQIVKTISDIWPADFGKPQDALQFHTDAQLLVVNGTPDQLDFIRQTLAALEQKVESARPKSANAQAVADQLNMLKALQKINDNPK
jgi:hypothetical protein